MAATDSSRAAVFAEHLTADFDRAFLPKRFLVTEGLSSKTIRSHGVLASREIDSKKLIIACKLEQT
ncbi:MAG TPA: hypothetical protein DHU55_19055 [Blastocatellia bacterium]|jgi:hypothetical protein|nr:hypothetical protein [Blastocatellia bacterium]